MNRLKCVDSIHWLHLLIIVLSLYLWIEGMLEREREKERERERDYYQALFKHTFRAWLITFANNSNTSCAFHFFAFALLLPFLFYRCPLKWRILLEYLWRVFNLSLHGLRFKCEIHSEISKSEREREENTFEQWVYGYALNETDITSN